MLELYSFLGVLDEEFDLADEDCQISGEEEYVPELVCDKNSKHYHAYLAFVKVPLLILPQNLPALAFEGHWYVMHKGLVLGNDVAHYYLLSILQINYKKYLDIIL